MFNDMPKRKFVYLGVIVLVVVLVVLACWMRSESRAKGFTVVYLTSQEIYVGHLHTFPSLTLTDGYILQNVQVNNGKTPQTDQQLVPLSGKPWAPTSITLNRNLILFYGPLSTTSDAFKAIQAKK